MNDHGLDNTRPERNAPLGGEGDRGEPAPDTHGAITDSRDPIEILADDFVERCRRGEALSIDEYASEHPECAERIRDLFPTIAAMEKLKTTKEKQSSGLAAQETLTIERLGDLRILAEIGRGGMGIVYEAVQESLGRCVAVKVLPKQFLLDDRRLRRFRREARTAAKLHHTNIVPVLGVGEHDGYHYYVMQYIRGVGLDEVIRRLGQCDDEHARTEDSNGSQAGRDGKVSDIAQALLCGEFPRADSSSEIRTVGSVGDDAAASDDASSGNRVQLWGHEETTSSPSPLGRGQGEGQQNCEVVSSRPLSPPEASPSTAASAVTLALTDHDTDDDNKADPVNGTRPTRLPVSHLGPTYWHSVARIGIQAADALDYAHEQGTLHRDIKPANLLLDSHGVVWVADFGLAKAIEQEDVSRTGDIVGTLRYMAPEQFRDGADARSDIYSLGLTLYELLTLGPAFDDAARKRALLGSGSFPELTRPRKLVPGIPRDLETIVLKAASPDPERRYQTAGELTVDLTCFLEDRPILAKRTSSVERLWRWCRRNRAVAFLTGTAALLLVLVAAMASIGYMQAKEANTQISTALDGEKKQREKAEATLGISLEALDRVAARFMPDQVARTESMTVEVDEGEEVEITARPVLSKDNAALLEDLLPFYDRLAEQYGDDVRLRSEAAKANRRVGDIQQRLGNFTQAAEAYGRAISKYKELADQEGDPGEIVAEIARVHNELGNVHLAMSGFEDAQASYLSALRLLESAAKGPSASDQTRYELARTCYYLGRRRFPGDRPGPPGPMRGEGRGPRPGHGGPSGFSPGFGRSGPRMLGPGAMHRGDSKYLDRAIDLLTDLNERHPSAPDYRHLMALCLRESSIGPFSEHLEQAISMLQEICRDFPNLVDYRFDLCETYARVDPGWPPRTKEESSIVEDRLRKALEIVDELAKKYPNEPAYMASQARIHLQLASSLQHRARLERKEERQALLTEAEQLNRSALAIQSSLAQSFPGMTSYVVGLAIVRDSLARLLADRSEFDEARSLLESAVSDLEGRLDSDPDQHSIRGFLFHNYMRYSTVLTRMNESELASEVMQRAYQMRGGSPRGKPRFGRGMRWGRKSEREPEYASEPGLED